MNRPIPFSATLIALAIASPPLLAADNTQLQQLQQEIAAMRKDYETQLKALEVRLKQAEASLATQAASAGQLPAAQAAPSSAPTVAVATPPPSAGAPPAAPSAGKGFNPDIALVLAGSYASFSKDPTQYRIPGFLTGGEIGPGVQGFSLGESELTMSATIDPWFYGSMSVALAADNSASVEEAFIQTTSLPGGLGLKAAEGRGVEVHAALRNASHVPPRRAAWVSRPPNFRRSRTGAVAGRVGGADAIGRASCHGGRSAGRPTRTRHAFRSAA